MFFRGFRGCTKEELFNGGDPKEDHSLDDAAGFSTSKRMMILLGKGEGLHKTDDGGEVIDRRTKISFSDKKYAGSLSYKILCQIIGNMPNKFKTVGSGFVIETEDGVDHILTCAHNLTAWSSFNECFMNYGKLRMYKMRQGENSWKVCSSLDEKSITIHPKYNGHPDCGYDFALCRTLKTKSRNVNTDSFIDCKTRNDTVWARCIPSTIKKGMSLEIAGYPGEKKGHPYTHTGEVFAVTKTEGGCHLVWYDIDCTIGNCGSPIMITDKDWIQQFANRFGATKAVIGIHTGQDRIMGLNYGTLITPSLFQWITEKK